MNNKNQINIIENYLIKNENKEIDLFKLLIQISKKRKILIYNGNIKFSKIKNSINKLEENLDEYYLNKFKEELEILKKK
jgi:uncharacterized protein YpuA (DUF1002 family)